VIGLGIPHREGATRSPRPEAELRDAIGPRLFRLVR
jgi:hypothetical protein